MFAQPLLTSFLAGIIRMSMFKVTEKIYHNPEWKKFLDTLDEKEQAIAGKTMAWIKKEYPILMYKFNHNVVRLTDAIKKVEAVADELAISLLGEEKELEEEK